MANSTVPEAHSVHGTNPQHLVERITRDKIYAMTYWKEKCFGVSAAALVDLAMEIREFGGVYGGTQRCTNFICLLLKMLQIQPDKEIVVEFIKNEEHKYVRMLGAFYLRLVGKPLEVYQYLEPLYNDYRRVRRRTPEGRFQLQHVDQFIDELLTHDMVCDIALPRIPHRWTLEATGALAPRRSVLEDDVEAAMEEGEDPDAALAAAAAARAELEAAREAARGAGSLPPPPPLREAPREAHERDRDRERPPRRRSRSRSRERRRSRSRDRKRRSRSRSRSRERKRRSRSRSRSRERRRRSRSRDRGAKAAGPPDAAVDPIAAENALRASLGLKPLKP